MAGENVERERLLPTDAGPQQYGTQTSSPSSSSSILPHPQEANDRDTASDRDQAADEEPSTFSLIAKLTGLYIGGFLYALDSTLVGTIGGPIAASLGNQKLLGWLASSFFIAACLSQPIVGKITDIYGRKSILIICNVILAIGNLICATTTTSIGLIAGRAVAGFGGGSQGPIASIILSDLVPLRQRGIWQGLINICFGIGSGLGGTVGGLITESLGWRWAFGIQIPVSALCVLMYIFLLPETLPQHSKGNYLQKLRRIDWFGALSLIVCLLGLLYALNTGESSLPWSHPAVIASLAVSACFLVIFLAIEGKVAPEPILPLALFQTRTVLAACLVNLFGSMARFGLLFYAPLLFQLQGYSITQTGLRFIPESVATAMVSIGAGFLMRSTGRFYEQGIIFCAIQALGIGLMASTQLQMPAWPPFVYLFTSGVGFSGMITTMIVAIVASMEQSKQAVSTSLSYLFRSSGSTIGISIASAVFQKALTDNLSKVFGSRADADHLTDAIQKDLHFLDHLPPELQSAARNAYLDALHTVFLTLTGVSVIGMVSASVMQHHKLHKTLSRT